ncbi:MAG: inositol monophosphatase family protein [Solirubrobacteraceae bacterium]
MNATLAIAEEAARAAGAQLVEAYGGEHAVHAKSTPTDLVSEADLAAEQLIRGILRERAPDDGIVGEEGEDVASASGRYWVIDPIDGTINFLFGYPQWCVSVACEGVAGVVYDPLRDELFAGGAGLTTTLNSEPVEGPAHTDLATALVATGFGYAAEQRGEQGAMAATVLPRCRDMRRAGSAALDLAWTAAGRVDAYYEHGVQRWDIAAGALLCAGVGLEVRPLRARGRLPAGLLVAPPAFADELQALVD